MQRLEQQMTFVAEAGLLKGVLRQTMLTRPARRENSAEHSWHLAVMALTLGDYAPPGTDLARVTAMLLVHDLVEVDAGDLFVYASAADQARQEAAERAAADRIFGLLPADQAASVRELWDEFEERRSPEARFARALDRLQPMLANIQADGGTWREHGITADQVLAKVVLIEDGSPELGRYARDLIERAVRDGILSPPRPVSG
jgi:5'-deoxynucleotidase YfbR-like HD superfamily hydrolase